MRRIVSALLTLMLFFVLGNLISENWSEIVLIEWKIDILLAPFVISLITVYVVNILSWHYLTRFLGQEVSLYDNTSVWLLSNLTRLIPGGIWQYPSRVMLMKERGVRKVVGTFAVVLELLFSLIVGSIVVSATLSFWTLPVEIAEYKLYLVILFVLPIFGLALLSNNQALAKMASLFNRLSNSKIVIPGITFKYRFLLPTMFLFVMRFVIIGLALFLLISMATELPIVTIIPIIGIFSLSWLIGYIVVFAPGGLGITEGMLTLLLSQYVPIAVAAAVAVTFRILLTATEMFLVFVVKCREAFLKSKSM